MNSITRSNCQWIVAMALSILLAPAALAQVRSVTLGITTHCPYGVGGCWAEIRNGLNLPDAIQSFPKAPDTDTQTCELRMQESWIPDPGLFARNFTNMNVGVDVRGVEAAIDGFLEAQGTNLVLRVNGTGVRLRVAPLTQKVQWDTKRHRPEPPTRSERQAFAKLVAQSQKAPARVRVVGPLIKPATAEASAHGVIEVRKFEVLKRAS